MDNSLKFIELRDKYKEFHFNKYLIKEDNEAIYLEYEFEIPNLTKFNPTVRILKKSLNFRSINDKCVKNLVFHIV